MVCFARLYSLLRNATPPGSRAQLFGCAIQERSRIEYLHNREIAAEYMELAQNSASPERRMVYLKMANGLALNGAPLVHRWRSVAVLVDGRD